MTARRQPDFAYEVDVDDVQAIALQAFKALTEAQFLFVRELRGPRVGDWLKTLAEVVARGAAERRDALAVNVAFTHLGLQAIGLDAPTRKQFGVAFQQGMSGGGGHRSWELGDVEDSAPLHWRWGNTPPPDDAPPADARPPSRPVHAVLLLYAGSAEALQRLVADQRRLAADCGVELYGEDVEIPMRGEWPRADARPTDRSGDPRGAVQGLREHFGFVDGISQPEFRLRADALDPALVAPGELLLGYPDESGARPPSPLVPASPAALDARLAAGANGMLDLGRNGTYLVFRQIAQDVHGFWEFAQAHAQELGTIEHCAAKLIGRWRNGAPLTDTPQQPADLNGLDERNTFQFATDDAAGRSCPVGAHVRRANPRDALPGFSPQRSLDAVQRHRILRRGRPFGAPLSGWPDPERMLAAAREHLAGDDPWPRGMHFICLNADIERQFEFIQRRWINDPTFVNQRADEVDPILGRQRGNPTFRVPADPTPLLLGRGTVKLRRFTRVIGGEYFFLPSQRALRYLAAVAAAPG
ncbi:MAG: hypothetical protein SF182_27160 [Deltaproteobacteria bacterium]|nr:hypothetical protein [Deltaproteobacteria bacterium]